ncbi:MAG: hypothetical protein ABI140_13985 [Jatrophihabitantaceae bacterium]
MTTPDSVLTIASERTGWPLVPLWSIARREDRVGQPDAELLSVYRELGVVRKADRDDNFNRASDDLSAYKVVRKGDLVLNKMKTWQGSLGVSDYDGIVSPAYFTCSVSPNVHGRFLHYLLRSSTYIALYGAASKGIRPNQWDLPYDEFRALPALVPPIVEQRRIADFLDDQVARIDNIIAARRTQASLAEEEFMAHRDEVTLGRGHSSPTARSRWEPFGAVPATWDQTLLRSIPATIQTGPFGSQLHSAEYIDDGWPVVNPAGLKDSRIVRVAGMTISDEVRSRISRHVLRDGDVVFGRRGELGRAALVTAKEDGWVLGTGSLMVRLVKGGPLEPGFLVRLLGTAALRYYFDSVSVGSTMANLNVSILAAMPVLVPRLSVQRTVIGEVAALDRQHRETSRALSRGVTLLLELKRSLITAAVTGEFDVSTADGSQVLP